MTNAEAIKIINQYDCNFYWTDGEKIPTEDLIDAFELAVKALDAQTPRVLSTSEIITTGDVVTCYLEVKGQKALYGAYLQNYDADHTQLSCDVGNATVLLAYGEARLWSSRPTIEQREATPWQE